MAEDTNPILHVVYAGYGESLYLEFTHNNQRHLVVIDGGPKYRGATSHHYAPYSEYFISAGQAIWDQLRKRSVDLGFQDPGSVFSPLAIINSHPDHDHYEGLIELIKNNLSADWSQAAQVGSRMFFNGPYLLPRPRVLEGTFFNPKTATCKGTVHQTLVRERNFNRGFIKTEDFGPAVPGLAALSIKYPSTKTEGSYNIWSWNRTQIQQPPKKARAVQNDLQLSSTVVKEGENPNNFIVLLGKQAGLNYNLPTLHIKTPTNVQADKSATNTSSMLVMMSNGSKGQIVLTGDGIGPRIQENCFSRELRTHVEIYKIQHHGSINNSLLLYDLNPYHWTLAVEVALRELMEIGWGEQLSQIAGHETPNSDQYFTVGKFQEDETQPAVLLACEKLAEIVAIMVNRDIPGTAAFIQTAIDSTTDPFAVALNASFPAVLDPGEKIKRIANMLMLAYLNRLRSRHAEYLKCFKLQANSDWTMRDLQNADIINMQGFEPCMVYIAMRDTLQDIAEHNVRCNTQVTVEGNIHLNLLPVEGATNEWHVDIFYNVWFDPKNNEYKVVCKPWWQKWGLAAHGSAMNSWLALYTTLRSIGLAMDFYSTFTADSYVVSANGTHGHPSPAVILAIALVAARDQKNKNANDPDVKRTLYVTLGHAIPAAWLVYLTKYVCPGDLDAVLPEFLQFMFGANGCLAIRYLSRNSVYMSLHGSINIANRDLLGSTEQWIPDQPNDTEDIYKILERDQSLLPANQNQGTRLIFYLGNADNGPILILDNPPDNPLALVSSPNTVYYVKQVLNSVQSMNYLLLQGQNQTVYHVQYEQAYAGGFNLFFLHVEGVGHQLYTWHINTNSHEFKYLPRQHNQTWVPVTFQATKAEIVTQNAQPVFHYQQHYTSMQSTDFDDDLMHQNVSAYKIDQTASLRDDVKDNFLAVVPTDARVLTTSSAIIEPTDTNGIETNSTNFTRASLPELMKPIRELKHFDQTNSTVATSADVNKSGIPASKKETKNILDYLKDAHLQIDTSNEISAQIALEAVIGADNVAKLDLARNLETSIMAYNIDKSHSAIIYDASGPNIVVYAATLQLQCPSNGKATIQGDTFKVDSSILDLEWNIGKSMTLKTKVEMDGGTVSLSLSHSIKTEDATRETSLARMLDYLCAEAGIPADFKSLAFPRAFSLLSNRIPQAGTMLLVERLPKWLVDIGLLKATIDINRSTVVAWPNPDGSLYVDQADLICDISKLLQEMNGIPTIADLKMSFGDVKLVLQQPGSAAENIMLEASVMVDNITLASSVAMVKPDPATAQDAIQWTFKASSTTSVSDLAGLWPNRKDSSAEVKEAPFSSSNTPLAGVKHSTVGFIVSQPIARVSKYDLASIFVVTSLDDWRKFLPLDLVKDSTKVTGRLEVRTPFDNKFRVISGSVDFAVEVITKNGPRELKTALIAEPKGTIGTYDYRLFISGSDKGVALDDIAKRLGWEEKVQQLSTSLPMIYEALESIQLRNLAVAIRNIDGKWSFTDLVLELSICRLQVLDNFVIESTDIDLQYSTNAWSGKVSGILLIANTTANVTLTLPRTDQKGFLDLESQYGVNISDVLTAFSLPTIEDIPMLTDVLTIELTSAILTLEKLDGKATITGTSFELELPKIQLDTMEITNVQVKIATGKLETEAKDVDVVAFSVQGVIRSKFAVTVAYNSFTRLLSADFQAGQPISIAESVKMILGKGTISDAFDAILGQLGVSKIAVEFDLETKRPKLFNITLVDTATVRLQDVTLERLRLEFVAAKPAEGASKALPAVFTLIGNSRSKPDAPQLSAIFGIKFAYGSADQTKLVEIFVQELSQGSLKLNGALHLFGWSEPETARPDGSEAPDAFDLAVRQIAGEVSVTKTTENNKTTSTIALESLDIIVEKDESMPMTMLPDLKLDKLALFIQYRKIANPSLQGNVWAQITLYEDILAVLRYSIIKGEKTYQEFYGQITKKAVDEQQAVNQKNVDFRKLAIKYLGQDTSPDGLDIPKEIFMPELEVRYQPKQKFEIRGDSGLQTWVISSFGDLKLTVTNLAGRLIVYIPQDGDVGKRFDATLYGALAFNSFTSLEAILHIKEKTKPILRALIKKQDSKTTEIAELTKSVLGKPDAWTELLPNDTKSLSFAQAEMRLVLDLAASTFVLAGFIQGIGFAVLIIKKDSEGRYSYLVSITLTNIHDIWPDLKDIIGDWMTFESISVQFSSKVYSLSTLKSDLELLQISSEPDNIAEPEALATTTTDLAVKPDNGNVDVKNLEELSKILDNTTEHIPEDGTIPQGICIHAVLAFEKAGPINEALQASTTMTLPPRVYLDAEVPKNKLTGGAYSIVMTDFALLGDAILLKKGLGTYNGVDKKLMISVELYLKLDGNTDPFRFDAIFIAQATQTSFEVSPKKEASAITDSNTPATSDTAVQAQQASAIKNPFGSMFDLEIVVTKFTGTITKPPKPTDNTQKAKGVSKYELVGTIKIAQLPLNVKLLFINGAPKLVTLAIIPEFPITQVYADIINRNVPADSKTKAEWPENDYDIIKLKQARVYYSNDGKALTIPDDKISYEPGFNILAEIELFQVGFTVTINLPKDRAGVSIYGSPTDQVSFGFGKLTRKPVREEDNIKIPPGGPLVSIKSLKDSTGNTEKQYGVVGGVELLDISGFSLDLTYQKNTGFTGTAAYTGTISVLNVKDPAVSVTYKDGKFTFNGLATKTDMKLNIAKAMRDAAETHRKTCPDIVKLLFDKATKTKFDYLLNFAGVHNKAADIEIKGQFTVALDIPATDITVKEVTFEIPFIATIPLNQPTASSLLTLLADTIVKNLTAIGTAILDEPAKASIIVGWMSVKDFTADLIAGLICRGIDPPNIHKRVWDLRPDNHPDDDKKPSNWWKSFLGAVEVIGSAALLYSSLNALSALTAKYTAYYESMEGRKLMLEKTVTRLETLASKGQSVPDLADFKVALSSLTTILDQAATKLVHAKLDVRITLNLKDKPAISLSPKGDALKVDWSKVVPQKVSSEFVKEAKDGFIWEVYTSLTSQPPSNITASPEQNVYETTGTSIQIHKEIFSTAPSIYTWVRAKLSHPKMTIVSRSWTACDVVQQKPRLLPVESVQLSVNDTGLEFLLTVPGGLSGITFEYQLFLTPQGKTASNNDALGNSKVITGSEVNLRIPIIDIDWHHLGHGAVKRQLQASLRLKSADTSKADSILTWSNRLPLLQGPEDVDIVYQHGRLNGTWVVADGAKSFEILFKNKDQVIARKDATLPLQLPVAGEPFEGKGEVQLYIRQKPDANQQAVSLFSRSDVQIPDIAELIISQKSFYDIPSSEFRLICSLVNISRAATLASLLTYPFTTTSSGEVLGECHDAVNISDFENTYHTGNDKGMILVRLPKKRLPSDLPVIVAISAVNNDGIEGPLSDKWKLPLPVSMSLTLGTFTTSFSVSSKTLTIKWSKLEDTITDLEFVVAEAESLIGHGGRRNKIVPSSKLTACFENGSAAFDFAEGRALNITVFPWHCEEVRGAASKFDFMIPCTRISSDGDDQALLT